MVAKRKPQEELEVTIMVDASGSMDARRDPYVPESPRNPSLYSQAMNGCDRFIEGLQYALMPIMVSVRTFSGGGYNVRLVNRLQHDEIPTPIDRKGTYPCGGTPLFAVMEREIDLLNANGAKRKALVVLTDGQDGSGYEFAGIAKQFLREGNVVMMIGIGSEAAAQLGRIKVVPDKYKITLGINCDVAEVMRIASEVMLDFHANGAKAEGFTAKHRTLAKTRKKEEA